VRRAAREQADGESSLAILRSSCGVGAVLAGLLFMAWGYVDRPHMPLYLTIVVNFLSCVVPALFLAGVVGLSVLCGRRVGALGWTGLVLASYGSVLGVVASIANVQSPLYVYVYLAHRYVSPYLLDWLALILTGLTLVGIATVGTRTLRGLAALLLATGAFGWVYYLTDSGAVLEARPVHIGFGLLFSLGWVALGLALWRGECGKSNNHTRLKRIPEDL
jgi:hypothetical protein